MDNVAAWNYSSVDWTVAARVRYMYIHVSYMYVTQFTCTCMKTILSKQYLPLNTCYRAIFHRKTMKFGFLYKMRK